MPRHLKSVTETEFLMDLHRRLMTYLDRIPQAVPADQILVHNHVRPARRLGTNGFRAWLAPRDQAAHYTPCACDWAGELGQHFRVSTMSSGGARRPRPGQVDQADAGARDANEGSVTAPLPSKAQ